MHSRLMISTLALLALPIAVRAQAPPSSSEGYGYAEVVAQSAFGNVTSQSYGGEFGVAVGGPQLQLFAEAGQIRNIATTGLGNNAQAIAAALTQVQPAAVTYSVKQPVTFFGAGIRYVIDIPDSKVMPYILVGGGAARVKNDVKFQLGGVDASSTISQFVTIGSDLSGSVTKPMMTLGGGVMLPVWRQLVLDFQNRFGRIFAEGQGINVNRAGLGVGVRF